jgi:hypothetical protein
MAEFQQQFEVKIIKSWMHTDGDRAVLYCEYQYLNGPFVGQTFVTRHREKLASADEITEVTPHGNNDPGDELPEPVAVTD